MSKLMKGRIIRGAVHCLTFVIITLASVTMAQILQSVATISNWVLTPVVVLLSTGAYAWGIRCIYNGARVASKLKEETATQTEALNDHSLVTKTDKDSRVTYVNDQFLHSTGYSRRELIGQSSRLYWPQRDDALLHELRQTLQRGEKWSGEIRLKSKSGKIIYTHTTYVPQMAKNGDLIGSIAIRTDITKNKIATGDKYMRRSLHILRDEIYMFEAGTLRFIYLNIAAMERCGWDEDTYTQNTIFERNLKFCDEGTYDIKAFYERARPLINDDIEEVTHELDIDGKPSEVKMQLVRPEVGQPYFMSIVRDISERSAFNKTKDDFISTVSHELRTPVTSIKGALELVLSGVFGDLSEKSHDMLNIAHRNTNRLGLIINDILDLEKIAAGRMEFHLEPVVMAELIQEAIEVNEPYNIQYGVSILGNGLEKNIMCYCDKHRVFQVMNNLLSNAAKFSKKGGEIIVTLKQKEDTVYVCVQDFGVGMPNEAKATIFDRFTQADSSDRRATGGTGLGLSIVKSLIEKQNGTINFNSKLGEGSSFFFELPKASIDIDHPNVLTNIAAE